MENLIFMDGPLPNPTTAEETYQAVDTKLLVMESVSAVLMELFVDLKRSNRVPLDAAFAITRGISQHLLPTNESYLELSSCRFIAYNFQKKGLPPAQ